MTVFSADLRTRQLEWARDDADRARDKANRAHAEALRLSDVARLAARVVAGLDDDGFRTDPPGGYDTFAATVEQLRQALRRVEL